MELFAYCKKGCTVTFDWDSGRIWLLSAKNNGCYNGCNELFTEIRTFKNWGMFVKTILEVDGKIERIRSRFDGWRNERDKMCRKVDNNTNTKACVVNHLIKNKLVLVDLVYDGRDGIFGGFRIELTNPKAEEWLTMQDRIGFGIEEWDTYVAAILLLDREVQKVKEERLQKMGR